jgi:hypothetical protein
MTFYGSQGYQQQPQYFNNHTNNHYRFQYNDLRKRYTQLVNNHLSLRNEFNNAQNINFNPQFGGLGGNFGGFGRFAPFNGLLPNQQFALESQRTQGTFDLIKTGLLTIVGLAVGIPLIRNIFKPDPAVAGRVTSSVTGGGNNPATTNTTNSNGVNTTSATQQLSQLKGQLRRINREIGKLDSGPEKAALEGTAEDLEEQIEDLEVAIEEAEDQAKIDAINDRLSALQDALDGIEGSL